MLAIVCLLENHGGVLTDRIRRLEHHLGVLNKDIEPCEARDSAEKEVFTDFKVELASIGEATCALEERA